MSLNTSNTTLPAWEAQRNGQCLAECRKMGFGRHRRRAAGKGCFRESLPPAPEICRTMVVGRLISSLSSSSLLPLFLSSRRHDAFLLTEHSDPHPKPGSGGQSQQRIAGRFAAATSRGRAALTACPPPAACLPRPAPGGGPCAGTPPCPFPCGGTVGRCGVAKWLPASGALTSANGGTGLCNAVLATCPLQTPLRSCGLRLHKASSRTEYRAALRISSRRSLLAPVLLRIRLEAPARAETAPDQTLRSCVSMTRARRSLDQPRKVQTTAAPTCRAAQWHWARTLCRLCPWQLHARPSATASHTSDVP